jgi:hypothetical protein
MTLPYDTIKTMSDHPERSLPSSIACFITPHGFGHAARATAVMLKLSEIYPGIQFHIYTKVPQWFFTGSGLQNFTYHDLLTDIGLAQATSFEEDLDITIERLEHFLPFDQRLIASLAQELTSLACQMILCDISPLGLAAAHHAGIPSLLIENFTWDWIYQGYPDHRERFSKYIMLLSGLFQQADFHIQTRPICFPRSVDRSVNPVSRAVIQPRAVIRDKIGW